MAQLTLSTIGYQSNMESTSVNAVFQQIENYLNGITPNADISITGNFQTQGNIYLGTKDMDGSICIQNNGGIISFYTYNNSSYNLIGSFGAGEGVNA